MKELNRREFVKAMGAITLSVTVSNSALGLLDQKTKLSFGKTEILNDPFMGPPGEEPVRLVRGIVFAENNFDELLKAKYFAFRMIKGTGSDSLLVDQFVEDTTKHIAIAFRNDGFDVKFDDLEPLRKIVAQV